MLISRHAVRLESFHESTGAMNPPAESRKSGPQRLLDLVEKLGNKVPHPAVLFLLLIAAVVVLSYLLQRIGTSATYQRVNLQTHEIESVTTSVNSLLSADGIRFIFTSVVPNFINFGPVGIILVAMIGVGLAERSGLIRALIHKIVAVAPESTITAIVITLGVLSSIASDAGYLVLIPLGAVAFHSLKRNPLAGLAAAFAGVAAAFGANFLVKPIDGILAEMTNDAIHVVDPGRSIDLMSNYYFGVASSVLLIVVCTIVSSWVVEPLLGKYQGESSAGRRTKRIRERNRKGLYTHSSFWPGSCSSFALLTLPANAPLRNPETGSIIGRSPFMDSLVFLITLAFFATGLAYGLGAKTINRAQDAIDAITKTLVRSGRPAVLVLRHQPVRGVFQL